MADQCGDFHRFVPPNPNRLTSGICQWRPLLLIKLYVRLAVPENITVNLIDRTFFWKTQFRARKKKLLGQVVGCWGRDACSLPVRMQPPTQSGCGRVMMAFLQRYYSLITVITGGLYQHRTQKSKNFETLEDLFQNPETWKFFVLLPSRSKLS
jgi:hypothetical protein